MRSSTFGLVLNAPDPYKGLVLRAEPNASSPGSASLRFERPSAYTPSPAYLNGTYDQLNKTGGFAYLNFLNLDKDAKDDYGVYLPDVGDGPGFVIPLGAVLGPAAPGFNVGAGQLYGQLRAAPNHFVACNVTGTDGSVQGLGLSWANVNSNETEPAGCVFASLDVVSVDGSA